MEEDLKVAKMIIYNALVRDYTKYYNDHSFIYKVTNEKINGYQDQFKNKTKMLSVIGSSDQIFNAILEGVKYIEAFDISIFPKYFLYLKKASIKALTKEEFIDFYYNRDYKRCYLDEQKKCKKYFERILKYLEGDSKIFWENLLKYADWMKIYESDLFSEYAIFLEKTIEKNKYLQGEYFDKLKSLIDDVIIKTYTGNIVDIVSCFKQENDLIYLSNIHNYLEISEFTETLKKLKLTENGIILSYIFCHLNNSREMFEGFNYKPINKNEGIMVYTKK